MKHRLCFKSTGFASAPEKTIPIPNQKLPFVACSCTAALTTSPFAPPGNQGGASGGEAAVRALPTGQTDAHQSQHHTRHRKNHCLHLPGGTQRRQLKVVPSAFPLPQVSPSSKRRTQTLQPIIEGETAHFWEEFKEEEEEERKVVEEEERDEDDEEEEEGESSGGEMQSPDVIMTFDSGTPTDVSGRSQSPHDGQGHCPMTDKMEEGSGRLALDLRLSSSNASSM